MSVDRSDNIGYNGNIMINKKEIHMELRVLTKNDLGKCADNTIIIPQPLYILSADKNREEQLYDYDDMDDLIWNIPQSEC